MQAYGHLSRLWSAGAHLPRVRPAALLTPALHHLRFVSQAEGHKKEILLKASTTCISAIQTNIINKQIISALLLQYITFEHSGYQLKHSNALSSNLQPSSGMRTSPRKTFFFRVPECHTVACSLFPVSMWRSILYCPRKGYMLASMFDAPDLVAMTS